MIEKQFAFDFPSNTPFLLLLLPFLPPRYTINRPRSMDINLLIDTRWLTLSENLFLVSSKTFLWLLQSFQFISNLHFIRNVATMKSSVLTNKIGVKIQISSGNFLFEVILAVELLLQLGVNSLPRQFPILTLDFLG